MKVKSKDLLNSTSMGAYTSFCANSGTSIDAIAGNGTSIHIIYHVDHTEYHKQPAEIQSVN